MKAGELRMRAAKALKVDDATVRNAMIAIRTAGFLTTGARGVNAPEMQPIDAARVILALVAQEQPGARAAETARAAAAMMCDAPDEAGPFCLRDVAGLRPPFALDVALAALISALAHDAGKPAVAAAFGRTRDGDVTPPGIEVEISTEGLAVLRMGPAGDECHGRYAFAPPPGPARGARPFDLRHDLGVERVARIGAAPILMIAEGFSDV
jgi:hypothetical protein